MFIYDYLSIYGYLQYAHFLIAGWSTNALPLRREYYTMMFYPLVSIYV